MKTNIGYMKIKELELLRSDRFILWVAIATLPLFSSNTYYVYNKISVLNEPYRNIVSLGVALVLASFIMIYTLRKNFTMAKYYSYFEALISAYYYIYTIGYDWALLPAFGFTLILPASLYYCSREIDKDSTNQSKELQEIQEHNILIQELIQDHDKLNKHHDDIIEKYNNLNIEHDKLKIIYQKTSEEFNSLHDSYNELNKLAIEQFNEYQNLKDDYAELVLNHEYLKQEKEFEFPITAEVMALPGEVPPRVVVTPSDLTQIRTVEVVPLDASPTKYKVIKPSKIEKPSKIDKIPKPKKLNP